MVNHRRRFFVGAAAAIVAIWLVAWGGHRLLESFKMTADKVRAYLESTELARLSGAARARAIQELEDMLNRLTFEERQQLRATRGLNDWFAQMTEAEKAQFIAATMPTGFQQMIGAFETLPEDKRHRVIDDALKNLRSASGRDPADRRTNGSAVISPELEAQIRTIGLSSFYSKSSAQTKAEVAPLLEEMQRQMELGRMFRRP